MARLTWSPPRPYLRGAPVPIGLCGPDSVASVEAPSAPASARGALLAPRSVDASRRTSVQLRVAEVEYTLGKHWMEEAKSAVAPDAGAAAADGAHALTRLSAAVSPAPFVRRTRRPFLKADEAVCMPVHRHPGRRRRAGEVLWAGDEVVQAVKRYSGGRNRRHAHRRETAHGQDFQRPVGMRRTSADLGGGVVPRAWPHTFPSLFTSLSLFRRESDVRVLHRRRKPGCEPRRRKGTRLPCGTG